MLGQLISGHSTEGQSTTGQLIGGHSIEGQLQSGHSMIGVTIGGGDEREWKKVMNESHTLNK